MRVAAVALALVLTVACGGNGFYEVQQTGTIEAYETFLAENTPDQNTLLIATTRLEELYLDKAKADATLEGYDTYLERFPEGKLNERGLKEREAFLFGWAKEQRTAEGWQKFLDEYPRAKKDHKSAARRGLAVTSYQANLEIGETKVEPINMAEDPEGEKDGIAWRADVTNKGDKIIKRLSLTVEYVGADGVSLGKKEWPVVSDNWGIPMPDEAYEPMKPGATRTWEWTEAKKRFPDGFDGSTVKLYPTWVSFVEAE